MNIMLLFQHLLYNRQSLVSVAEPAIILYGFRPRACRFFATGIGAVANATCNSGSKNDDVKIVVYGTDKKHTAC